MDFIIFCSTVEGNIRFILRGTWIASLKIYVRGEHGSMFPYGGHDLQGGNMTYVSLVLTNQKWVFCIEGVKLYIWSNKKHSFHKCQVNLWAKITFGNEHEDDWQQAVKLQTEGPRRLWVILPFLVLPVPESKETTSSWGRRKEDGAVNSLCFCLFCQLWIWIWKWRSVIHFWEEESCFCWKHGECQTLPFTFVCFVFVFLKWWSHSVKRRICPRTIQNSVKTNLI